MTARHDKAPVRTEAPIALTAIQYTEAEVAALEHGGDFRAAARALGEQGFGDAPDPASVGEGEPVSRQVRRHEKRLAAKAERNGTHPPTDDTVPARLVRLTPAATIRPRPVRWAWQDRLPAGEVAMTSATRSATAVVQVTAGQRPSRTRPCPVCRKRGWCLFTSDGRFICCQRSETWDGRPAIRRTDAGWLFPLTDDHRRASSLQPVDLEPGNRDRPPALPPELLDRIYRDLAALCGLRDGAREDLINKRSFPEATETGLYFSLPRAGKENRAIASALIAKYGEAVIARVPGFTRRGGELGFRSVRAGREDYAVMGLDEDGLAFWGYSRRLPFDPEQHDAKYMLLSSSRDGEASLAGLPKYHVAGRQYPANRVWFTEGVTKAEITAARLRCRVIGFYSTSVDGPTLRAVTALVGGWA